ncbi:MAG: aminotransferase class V-fold PLP-dependent enzyme [Acidobacteriaceae bacterium]
MKLVPAWSRRSFLSTFGATVAGLMSSRRLRAAEAPAQSADFGTASASAYPRLAGLGSTGDIYAELGVTPVINAAGTYTVLGGSLMASEVLEAMRLGNENFVDINGLEVAAGKKMAELCRMPAGYTGLVTGGAAAALLVGYAGILTGDNQDYIRQIPDMTGMPKTEVIIQKAHRYSFDHQVRQTGVKLVEVETREELIAAIRPHTAAMHFTNFLNDAGRIKVDEFIQLAKQHSLPAFNDAAADTPPISRLWDYTHMGYDLVTFSGGKDIRGPQAAGLLMGREDLIRYALLNMSPNEDTIGRASKVGKEEICGMLKALEMFVRSDQQQILKDYHTQLSHIETRISSIPGVTTTYEYNPVEIANNTVRLAVTWDPSKIALTKAQVTDQLAATRPLSIQLSDDGDGWGPGGGPSNPTIQITAWMLKPGQEAIVADRLVQILQSSASKA